VNFPGLDLSLPPARHKRLRVVLQSEASECGLACLAIIADFHGKMLEMQALRRA
jgi:ATP-binding cassette subfamily B protein RaxB